MFYENYFNAVSSQKYTNKQKGFSSYFVPSIKAKITTQEIVDIVRAGRER